MEERHLSLRREDTQEIASRLASRINYGRVICLWGDLSAGKTTFAQGIAQFFGITRLTSPTFLIMKEYPIKDHSPINRLYHLDLYRLQTQTETKAFNLDEITADSSNLVLIEWPERLEGHYPKGTIHVYLNERSGSDEREIIIKGI